MKFNQINTYISPKAKIGKNVRIGDNTFIYDNVEIGDNSIISNNCIIGEPTQQYYYEENYENKPCIIGANALIRSHTIIYCNNKIGDNFSTGHRVTIRENMQIGNNCRVGTLSDFQGHASIGNYCWFHSNVHIGQQSKIGNFVFIYPYVVLTNDPHPPSNICIGPTIDDYAQIAVAAVILPNIKIGKHALIAAHAVVGKDVNDYELVAGNPAKVLKDVRELKSRESGKSHYPWVYNFERGMPWENIGYDNWRKQSDSF